MAQTMRGRRNLLKAALATTLGSAALLRAGSLTWAGLFNTRYWIDPARRVAGVIMMQVLPFGDDRAMWTYGEFEQGVYGALKESPASAIPGILGLHGQAVDAFRSVRSVEQPSRA